MKSKLYWSLISILISLALGASSVLVTAPPTAANSAMNRPSQGFSLQGEVAPVNWTNIDGAAAETSDERHTREVTLITGDIVSVTTLPDGSYSFIVRPPDPKKGQSFQTFETPEGKYVIPGGVNLEKLDVELFNIKYLIEEGYYLLPSLPVIIEIEEEGEPAETVESITSMVEDVGAKVTMSSPRLCVLATQLPFTGIRQLSQSLLEQPDVKKLWLDRKVRIGLNESVPLIGAPECWDAGYNGTGVKIAILDTGIDATHPDLDDLDDDPSTTDPKVIVAKDFTSDGFTEDLFGHGTHCASIAAGTGNASDYLYKGVAPGANLFNVKVLTAEGWGYDSWIIDGIEYATLGPDGIANTGDEADVLSMSFGADWNGDGTDPVSLAIDWATDQGAICVVAAGNIGPQMFTVGMPAVAKKAITVGASTKADTIVDFSSRGPSADLRLKPDVVAPGVSIIAARAAGTSMGSPVNDLYTSASGTSMSTPHVAGAAALVLQANPTWEPTMVKSALTGYARVIADAHLWDQGGGRIQVPQAAEATLLAIEPSLSFGRLGMAEIKSATVALMNLGDAPASVNITTYTICEGVETNYVSVTPGSMEIPAGESRDISVEVGPLDDEAPEGWYEGWVIISYDGETLRVPYLFGAFSTISTTIYDVDDTTEIEASMILATYPDMEFVASGWGTPSQFRVKSGEYALLASSGWIEDDFSRMFMIQKIVTVPKLSDVDISLSLAEARVSEIPTINADGENLTIHCYTQYFSGDPYYGETMMHWSMGYGWFGFDISVPALTFYSSEYASADKLSEAFGYYASENLLCETYLPSNIYLLNWKYYDIPLIPSTITYDPSDLARYNFFYDMPETYPENGLNIMNAFWFTWEYLGGSQGWWWDTHSVLAGMNATYNLAPDIATYWGYYMPTYGGWGDPSDGPIQEWYVGQDHPYPQIPPEKGETGNITLGEFQFAPYVPGLTLQVTPGGGSTKVDLTGEIWTGLTWPHWQGGELSPYPPNRIPHYEFYVDDVEVANGSLGRPDGTFYEGLWWDNVSESWDVTGERGLLRVHMPTLATISNWSTYELDFDLASDANIPPLFNTIVVPPSYFPGENITIELQAAGNITALTLEYSFDKGTSWQVAEETAEGYLIPSEMADELSVRISGTDANGNSVMYVSHAISLSGEVKLEAPQRISAIPGWTMEISGSLTTIEGEGLKGLAVSMSDGEILTYTSPDEEGAFAFAYEVNELPQELVIASPTAGVYDSAAISISVEFGPVPPTLVAPLDGSLIEPGEILFQWNAIPIAADYRIQIDTVDAFDSPDLISETVASTNYTHTLSLGTWYWHVLAIDGEGNESDYSPTWHFSVAEPVVQVTTDPGWDEFPAIAQTDDGKVWVVWQSYRSGSSDIWYKTSSDGGATWSNASPIDTGIWGYDPAITETNDGKIWVTFYSYESGNDDIWYTTSSDGGSTWSEAAQITTDPGDDYDPSIAQTDDGKVWVVWQSYRSGNPDIWYKTSSDGGSTWSEASPIDTGIWGGYDPAIIQTNDGKIWVTFYSYKSGNDDIWYTTSSDGGSTWSEAAQITNDPEWDGCPVIAQTDDGKVWVVWNSYRSGNSDIWYKTSSDGGATWSEASQFTRFVGYDEYPAATALSSGKLALAWQSDRAVNYDIWYGVIGSMEDINPPPHLDWAGNEPRNPDTEQTVTVRAQAGDELGVQDVQLVWWVDGSPQGNLLMYDDGNHDDWGANNGVYGVHIGPFPLIGTVVEYQIQITDIENNTILAPQYPYSFEVIEPFVKTADILLVSDVFYSNWVVPYYSDALDNLGYAHDVWDSDLRGSIDGGMLNQYVDGVVIWSTPDWGYIQLSETQDNLSSYLDNGGKLFISGQYIDWNIGWSAFYEDYLHAQYVQHDIDLYGLFGVTGDPITDGLYVSISGGDGANNQYYLSEIDPISPAVSIFTYDPNATTALVEPSISEEEMIRPESEEMLPQREPMAEPGETMIPRGSSVERSIGTKSIESSGTGALRVDTGTYKVVYFAFGFEAINSAADRATVMGNVLDWLAPIVTYNLTISSTSGGSVTTPGEGTFGPYSPGEVVNLLAGAEPDYHFTNWTGDIDTIVDVNSRRTTIIMNGDYFITANFAEGAAEVDSEWGKVGTPYTDDWTVAPGSDIIVPASVPGGSVIYVAGFGYEDNDMNASYGPRLWKSEDGGVTWDDIASKVWNADSLPAIFNSSTSYFNYVACALDDPDFMAVAVVDISAAVSSYDYCNMTQTVVISDDGGDNFYWMRDVTDSNANATLNCVFDMAISDEDNDGKRSVAIGGVGTRNGTYPTGLVFRCQTGGLFGGGWVDASAYDGWDNVNDDVVGNDIASLAVTKVAFAPSWLDDKTVLAVSHTDSATYLQSGSWGNTTAWNAAAGFEAAVLLANDPSMWTSFHGAAAGLALPTDYEGRHATTRYAWVYVDNTNSTGVIYKVQNGDVSQVIQQITGKPWLASLSYLGSIDSGKAIAGLLGDGAGYPTACGEGVQVYRNDGITDMDICCQHWSDACKPPTGTMLAMVGYVLPNKAYAFVSGQPSALFDESAFSFSLDDGDTWNQLGLVDTYVDYLSDVAKSADCSKTWMVSINTEDGVCECDSVWLKASWLPEASEYSGAWIRDWCGSITSSEELNSAQTPEMGLLRVPKETEEALTVYLVDRGTDKVYYDGNKGLGCWEEGTSTVDEISDLAVQDEATIYALGFNADVAVSDDHASAASWSSTMDSKVDEGHTIAVLGEGNVLVGGDDGKVSYSDDNLSTFLDGEATFTELNGIGDGRVHVAFDSYFDTNSVVYAAVSNVVGDNMSYETPVNAVDNGIYRWVIGESSEWKDLGECAGAATPTETQLGLGPSCDTVEVGYYGIVLSNAEGNPETDATTGGVLYATFYDAEGNVTGVARCLNPAEKVACGEGMWDYFIQDTADNHGQFTLEPSSLKLCGCLTPDTNGKLRSIDDNPYYDHFAFGDLEDLSVGRLWMYEDCYAKAGPVLESPADGAGVSCDPHYWWNDAFALEWDRQCDASSYNIQIAYDEDFTELVLDISGKNSDCTEYDYEPISGSSPSYVVAEGALGAGSCGTTFYWRVRSADAETGEIIHSPWSEARSFTVAGEPKYYNLTISSTSGGNVTTPGEGTFSYSASEVVSLVATSDTGYHFVNWTGDVGTIGDVNSANTTITMTGDFSIVANFAEGAPAPVWSVGDNWVYNCSYENPEGTPKYGSSELNVTVVAEEAMGGEDAYKLSGVFVPQAARDSIAAGMTLVLHVGQADIWQSQANLQYLKQCSAIKELPGLPACITWAYTTSPSWPLTVGDTWDFTKHTVAGGGMIDELVNRQGKVLAVEDITVPAGTFSCYHIVEYDPAIPDTYTYEHWFNATVKSDVKQIDRDTWAGAETRVLTSFSVQYNLTINSTSGGNVTTPGEGTFTYNASEVVSLVATADSGYQFVNWTGNTSTIANPNALSTTITMNGSYTITANFVSKSRPGAGGGGGGQAPCYLDIDMLGNITRVRIACTISKTLESCVAPDFNNTNFLEIDYGTTMICNETGEAPEALVMRLAEESPPVPDGSALVGSVYNFTGNYGYNMLKCCSGVTFGQNITIVLNYDPNELPESTASLAVAYYDTEQGIWVSLPPDIGRVAEIGKSTGLINHFSTVAIIAELAPAPAPASFVASALNIEQSPQVWKNIFVGVTGENVTITANVANNGGQEGTYIAELKLNGETVDAKEVTLAAGQSQQVSFTLSGMDYGQYEVEIAGLSGEFTVSQSINWWLIFGIIVGVGLITWGAIWGRKRRIAI